MSLRRCRAGGDGKTGRSGSEDSGLRGQKTDEFAALSRRSIRFPDKRSSSKLRSLAGTKNTKGFWPGIASPSAPVGYSAGAKGVSVIWNHMNASRS
ncbi:MAG: hypothetical protein LBD06_06185, partial [Candidatus Accumulibacter sp.]|nr:hypothetical protein [Accumulibacter sp.]